MDRAVSNGGTSAAARFEEEGFAVLEGVLPPTKVERLRDDLRGQLRDKERVRAIARSTRDDPRKQRNEEVGLSFVPEGGNHDFNRWNLRLPSRLPFLDPEVFANPRVLALMDAVLQADLVLAIMAADVNMPGSAYQNAHQDYPSPSICVNVPLITFDEQNGPIEVWPRSHRARLLEGGEPYSLGSHWIAEEELQEIVRRVPPHALYLEAGSVLVRDHRLVHRGTPNRSTEPRPMLTFNFFPLPPGYPVAPQWMSNVAARAALFLRERGARRMHSPGLLALGNGLGRHVFHSRLSDRDHRRRVPGPLWASFPPRARSLLRYAQVEGAWLAERGSLRRGFRLWRESAESIFDFWLEDESDEGG